MKSTKQVAAEVVQGYGADVLTGNAPGISLVDMIEIALDDHIKHVLNADQDVLAGVYELTEWLHGRPLCMDDEEDAGKLAADLIAAFHIVPR